LAAHKSLNSLSVWIAQLAQRRDFSGLDVADFEI
jgi:hypothetical protein